MDYEMENSWCPLCTHGAVLLEGHLAPTTSEIKFDLNKYYFKFVWIEPWLSIISIRGSRGIIDQLDSTDFEGSGILQARFRNRVIIFRFEYQWIWFWEFWSSLDDYLS